MEDKNINRLASAASDGQLRGSTMFASVRKDAIVNPHVQALIDHVGRADREDPTAADSFVAWSKE